MRDDIDADSEKAMPRHLTPEQQVQISNSLQDSAPGPVSMTAAASDKEAVCYEGEIASVLKDTGFTVKIENSNVPPSAEAWPSVEMAIQDETVRPGHAYRIVRAFRNAGVAIATRINRERRKNDTLYITIGPSDAHTAVPRPVRIPGKWQAQVLEAVRRKWREKFASGL
jgi:hypothetical protein